MDPSALCARAEAGKGAWSGRARWSRAVRFSVGRWVYVDNLFCTSNFCFSFCELYLKPGKCTLIIWGLGFI